MTQIPEAGWRLSNHLQPLEETIIEHCAAGRPVDLDKSVSVDPSTMDTWGPERTMRASVLLHLLTEEEWPVNVKGIHLRGVRISGPLDLEGATLRCPLWLNNCFLDDSLPIILDYATVSLLVIKGCRFAGLHGNSVTIAKGLDLSDSSTAVAVWLVDAEITGQLNCRGSQLGADPDGNSLVCNGIKVGGEVSLDGHFTAQGAALLQSANIAGQLSCRGARLGSNKDKNSLVCDGARVDGGVILDTSPDGVAFAAAGAVRLYRANVGGQFSCRGAQIGANVYGNSVVADVSRVGGGVVFDTSPDGKAFVASGAVRFPGADVTGSVSCRGAQLSANDDGNALVCDGMRVSVDVLLGSSPEGILFTATGTVRLARAEIVGQLRCEGAQLQGADARGDALVSDWIRVGGGVVLDQGFTAAGSVRLLSASIVGSLNCRGTRLGVNDDQNALVADGLKVTEDVLFDTSPGGETFISAGAIRLMRADIAGQLRFGGAQLRGTDEAGDALIGAGLKLGGSVQLNQGFMASGAVRLTGADIGGSLNCRGSVLGGNGLGDALVADGIRVTGGVLLDNGFVAIGNVSLRSAQILRELRWAPAKPPDGVNLEGASVRQLTDDWSPKQKDGHWPKGRLRLAGFTYVGFGGEHQASWRQRLEWIRLQYPGSGTDRPDRGGEATRASDIAAPFVPQPYKQLAEVYTLTGLDSEARQIAIARRQDLRRFGNLPKAQRLGNWLLDKTIKYGYQTWRAAVALALLYLVTVFAFMFAQHQRNLIIPSQQANTRSTTQTALHCVPDYPCFYPAGYALDIDVPLINIHQADNWRVNGSGQWGWVWVAGTWVATVTGWALATLLVAGYSGIVRKD